MKIGMDAPSPDAATFNEDDFSFEDEAKEEVTSKKAQNVKKTPKKKLKDNLTSAAPNAVGSSESSNSNSVESEQRCGTGSNEGKISKEEERSSSSLFNFTESFKAAGGIPGLDLVSSEAPEAVEKETLEFSGRILDKIFPDSEERDSSLPQIGKSEEQLSITTYSDPGNIQKLNDNEAKKDEDSESNKVRRSSRIKNLEDQRGPRLRRREVVFSSSQGNRSYTEESTSSTGLPNIDTISSTSDKDLVDCEELSGGVNGGVSKPLKVKDRWKSLSAMEARRLSDLPSAIDISSLAISSSTEAKEILERNIMEEKIPLSSSHVTRPGHVVYDSLDEELTEKLKHFDGIDDNIYRTTKRISKESKGMVCDCFLTKEEIAKGELGCSDNCLNRLLMVECGPRCPNGDYCTNRRFQKREYCALEVIRTERKGHGLRTREHVPAGGFVIEYVGEVLDVRGFEQRIKEYAKHNQEHFYFMALKSDAIIDATMKGNCSRFINHSCEPNCETQKWTVNGELRIGFFAIHDLNPGDEISFDYQFQRYGKNAQKCFCETPSCRGWIGEDDDEEYEDEEVDEAIESDDEAISLTQVKKSKTEKKTRSKRRKHLNVDIISFEEEIAKLEKTGMKNRSHTLALNRLMVRSDGLEGRERMLRILIAGDTPCRRLFLDYQGLNLLGRWMDSLSLPVAESDDVNHLRDESVHLALIDALSSLPLPDKTFIMDSKIVYTVQKWAECTKKTILKSKTVVDQDSHCKERLDTVDDQSQKPVECKEPELIAESEKLDKASESKPILNNDQEPIIEGVCKEPLSSSVETDEAKTLNQSNHLISDSLTEPVKTEPEEEQNFQKSSISKTEPDKEEIVELNWNFVEAARQLLNKWYNLPEAFHIPRKERVKQMKEHEREADRGILRDSSRIDSFTSVIRSSYEKMDSAGRKKSIQAPKRPKTERRVPVLGSNSNSNQSSSSHSFVKFPWAMRANPNLSKEEKRELFAAAVAREEEEERQRKKQDEMVTLHQDRCSILGLDAATTPIVDPTGTYYLEPSSISWKLINLDDPILPPDLKVLVRYIQQPVEHIQNQKPVDANPEPSTPEPEFVFPPWPEGLPPPPPLPPSTLPKGWGMAIDDEGRCFYYHVKTKHSQWYPPSPQSSEGYFSETSESSDVSDSEAEGMDTAETSQTTERKKIVTTRAKNIERAAKRKRSGLVTEHIISPILEEDSFCPQRAIRAKKIKLLESKKSMHLRKLSSGARSTRAGKKSRLKNLGMAVVEPTINMEEDSKAHEIGDVGEESDSHNVIVANSTIPDVSDAGEPSLSPLSKDNGDILAQHVVESVNTKGVPIPGLDGEIPRKSKTRRKEEKHKAKDKKRHHSLKKIKLKNISSSGSEHHKSTSNKKAKSKKSSPRAGSSKAAKHSAVCKEAFRNQIASVVVAHLNPYRKPDCLHGRITSTEHFKHLARKMTHVIVLKELKHTRDEKSLEVTESVKYKTKEFIRKFMARFQDSSYAPSPDESQ